MYFITSPVMLDMVKMLTPESIANVSNSLRFNKQEFVQYCNAGKCEEADKKMCFYAYIIMKEYRSCLKIGFHDTEAFLDFPTAFADF